MFILAATSIHGSSREGLEVARKRQSSVSIAMQKRGDDDPHFYTGQTLRRSSSGLQQKHVTERVSPPSSTSLLNLAYCVCKLYARMSYVEFNWTTPRMEYKVHVT